MRADETAFARYVTRHQDALFNFFLRKNIGRADAEDLAQRVFLKIWRHWGKWEGRVKETTFLFMVAQRCAVDFFRAAARRDRLARAAAEEAGEAVFAPDDTSPDDAALRAVAQLARLPERYRAVVELAVMQSLPLRDVAEILSIPEGTVKSRLFNALGKLRARLRGARGKKGDGG